MGKFGGKWVEICLFDGGGLLEDGVLLRALGNELAVRVHGGQVPRDRPALK